MKLRKPLLERGIYVHDGVTYRVGSGGRVWRYVEEGENVFMKRVLQLPSGAQRIDVADHLRRLGDQQRLSSSTSEQQP